VSVTSEAIQPAVLRTNHHPARGYRPEKPTVARRLRNPKASFRWQIEHVEMAVVGTDVHPAVRYGGGRIDARLGGERPDGLAGSGVQAMDQLARPPRTMRSPAAAGEE